MSVELRKLRERYEAAKNKLSKQLLDAAEEPDFVSGFIDEAIERAEKHGLPNSVDNSDEENF